MSTSPTNVVPFTGSSRAPESSHQAPGAARLDPAKASEDFVAQNGLDVSHKALREALTLIDDTLADPEINGICDVTFGKVADVISLKPARKKLGNKEHRFDIQGVEHDALINILNTPFSKTGAIPLKDDTFTHVSPTTGKYLTDLFRRLRERRFVYTTGPTGTGKTTMAKTLAFHLNVPLYQDTGTELKSFTALVKKSRFQKNEAGVQETIMVPSGLVKAAITGGIYLIDEFNYLPGDVQLAIAQMVDDNEILLDNGVRIPIHPKFGIIATGNNLYGGTKTVNDAVLRRAGGEMEVSYLPEEEEIEVIYRDYMASIDRLNKLKKINIPKNISREEVEKIVKLFREMRQKMHDAFRKGEKGYAMDDGVCYGDQFSFRKISGFIVLAAVSQESVFRKIFDRVFTVPPLTASQKVVDDNSAKFFTITFGPKEDETKQKVSEDEVKRFSDFILCKDLKGLTHGQMVAESYRRLTESVEGSKADASHLRVVQPDERGADFSIPDYEHRAVPESEEKMGHLLTTNPVLRRFAAQAYEHILGYRRDGTGRPVFEGFAEPEKPDFRSFKHLVEFDAGGQKGYAMIGFHGIVRDAIFYDPEDEKHYVLNKDRLKTHIQVFVPDPDGRILIHPEKGEILPAAKVFDVDVLLAEGYRRVRVCKKTDDEGKIRRSVQARIESAFLHASDVPQASRKPAGLQTVTAQPESAFEGRPVYALLNDATAGRYLKYKTPSIEEVLKNIEQAHKAGHHVLLIGPSGTGKTSVAKTYAMEHSKPYVSVQMHSGSGESQTLKKIRLQNGEVVEVPLPLLEAYKYGWVAELRELNTAFFPKISFLNTLLDPNSTVDCEGEAIHAHPDFLLLGTMNKYDPVMHPGTNAMPSSLPNRFDSVRIDFAPADQERDLATQVLEKENKALLGELDLEQYRGMFGIMADVLKIVRDKMADRVDRDSPLFRILQQRKLSTDMLIDIARFSKSKKEVMERFLSRFEFSEQEKNVLEKYNLKPPLDALIQKFNAYL